ncbi:putative membrane protein, partial [Acinetobacter baumannii 947299]
MDSFTLTLYVSSLLLLQSLSFLFKDEVEEFDTSLICLSLMCAVGIKASFIFFTT